LRASLDLFSKQCAGASTVTEKSFANGELAIGARARGAPSKARRAQVANGADERQHSCSELLRRAALGSLIPARLRQGTGVRGARRFSIRRGPGSGERSGQMNYSKFLSRLMLVAAALWIAVAPPPGGAEVDSKAIALEVEVRQALQARLGDDSLGVDVRAMGGTVLLGGTVNERATAELAEEVAHSVPGIVRVENEIQLAESNHSEERAGVAMTQIERETERELRDAALATRVRFALVDRLGSDGLRIGIDVADGTVTLHFAGSFEAGSRAEARATVARVSGVRRVILLAP
jgi:osmotically-inducible protein OsmY